MSSIDEDRAAAVDSARAEATTTEPFLLAQAVPPGRPGGGTGSAAPATAARRDPRVKPHPATRASWEELVVAVRLRAPAKREVATQAIELLLHTRTGQRLVDDLHRVLFGKGRLVSRIVVDFRDKRAIPGAEAAGLFEPRERRAPRYTTYVAWTDYARSAGDVGSNISGMYVAISSGLVMMAASLFHELLHVWFIHHFDKLGPDDAPDTGHTVFNTRTSRYDSIHPEFLERLRDVLAELAAIEAHLFGPPARLP